MPGQRRPEPLGLCLLDSDSCNSFIRGQFAPFWKPAGICRSYMIRDLLRATSASLLKLISEDLPYRRISDEIFHDAECRPFYPAPFVAGRAKIIVAELRRGSLFFHWHGAWCLV